MNPQPAPAANDAPHTPDAANPADWTVVQLLQHVEAHRATLGDDGSAALYELWLAHHPGPDAAGAQFNLGALQQQRGRLDEAERHYRAVIDAIDLPQARFNLGLVLERAGRGEEAVGQWWRVAASSAPVPLRQQALGAVARLAGQRGWAAERVRALTEALDLDPAQPGLREDLARAEAALATGATDAPAASGERDPVVYVVAVCFNEAPILPFFLDHYVHYVGASKVILHDGGSTDGSAEIAARYPQVEFIVSPSEKLDDRDLMRIRNEAWKPYREQCDWMVVCDVDEFLHAPDLRGTLRELKRQGITLPMVQGFNMIAKSHPAHQPGRYLWQDRQAGWPDPRYLNKNLIFDPAIDINYTLGCHNCQPTGPVRRSAGFVFKNLHMCMPSYRHVIEKSRRSAARLSEWNKQTHAGFHYALNAEMTRAQYNDKFLGAANVVAPLPRPPLRREGFDALRRALVRFDLDARILEVGTDLDGSGSTEFLAWYVHDHGGRLLAVEGDGRRLRHARFELARRGLQSDRIVLDDATALPAAAARGERFDLVYFGAADQFGDAADRAAGQRQALLQFLDVAPRLAPGAIVALDAVPGRADDEGRFALLAALLRGRGWQAEHAVDTMLFRLPA